MPELPEVEAARRAIEEHCLGKKIVKSIVADDSKVIDGVSACDFEASLLGKTLVSAHRKGKNLWLRLDSPPFPSFQFGMAGAIYIKGVAVTNYKRSAVNDTDEWPSKYSKFFVEIGKLTLDDGLELSFTDKRRFAKVRLLNNPASLPPISELGPDALLEPMTVDEFTKLLSKKKLAIKALLLDQADRPEFTHCKLLPACPKKAAQLYSSASRRLFKLRLKLMLTAAAFLLNGYFIYGGAKSLEKSMVIEKAIEVGADSSQFPNNWIFHSREKKPGKALVDGKKIDFITAGGRTTAYVPELQKLDGVQAAKAVGKPKKQNSKRKGSKDDDEDDGTDEPESDREENPENVKTKKGGKSGGRGKMPSKRRKSEETDDEDGDDDDIGDEDEVPKTRSRNLTKNKQGEAVKTSKEKGISQKRKNSKTKGTYCLSDYLPSNVNELWEY
ncbi:hypothetical protein EZV62_004337 [Acer yangbiense]|uniref:Formamidopyrimidine-DNA glycosylase catalytic domain-containing protein n=1 Tax=Acer yangbiense TaxID=1000413 RepID=A0A5C7ILA3_9ROSI|nr:hypothetical protein EZV62_004337 [Acer yangbiense]